MSRNGAAAIAPVAGSSIRIRPARSTTSTRPLSSGSAATNTGCAKPVPTRRTWKPPPTTSVITICTVRAVLACPSLATTESS